MKLINRVLAEKGLPIKLFNDAFDSAIDLYEKSGIHIEKSPRVKFNAALSYRKDSSVCDLGTYINAYPVILALLGMRVTIVDYYPQALPEHPKYSPHIPKALDLFRSVGIDVVLSDLYDMALPENSFDVMTAFETFEHLWQSPKPICEKILQSLKQHGEFILSIPNFVRLLTRIKVIAGQSPMHPFPDYYDNGNPFTGHRREMTMKEVDWLMGKMGLAKSKLLCTNLKVPVGENASSLGRLYMKFVGAVPLPQGMSETIFAVYRRS